MFWLDVDPAGDAHQVSRIRNSFRRGPWRFEERKRRDLVLGFSINLGTSFVQFSGTLCNKSFLHFEWRLKSKRE